MTARTAPRALVDYLEEAHVDYELIPHPRTDTAAAEAKALGVEPNQVAKTLVLTTPEGFVRIVLPASERFDSSKVRTALDTKDVRLATEDVLAREYPEFELGAVPPIAGAHRDRVLIDRRLLEQDSVVLEAGTHEQSLRLKTTDLARIAEAGLADLCQD
jgi:Ala-tRNA(Pro) deacylase